MLFYDLCYGLQILPLHHCPGGIVGVIEEDDLGLIRYSRLQVLRPQLEIILIFKIYDHGDASCKPYAGLIGYKGGLRYDHLIPGIQHGTEAQVYGFGASYRHDYLILRIIGKLIFLFEEKTQLIPELLKSRIGRIEGLSSGQGIDALLPHMPGRIKIRLSHSQ